MAEGLGVLDRASEDVYGGHSWGREAKNVGCLLESREEALELSYNHIRMVASPKSVLQPQCRRVNISIPPQPKPAGAHNVSAREPNFSASLTVTV